MEATAPTPGSSHQEATWAHRAELQGTCVCDEAGVALDQTPRLGTARVWNTVLCGATASREGTTAPVLPGRRAPRGVGFPVLKPRQSWARQRDWGPYL